MSLILQTNGKHTGSNYFTYFVNLKLLQNSIKVIVASPTKNLTPNF